MIEFLFHPKLAEHEQFATLAEEAHQRLYGEILPTFNKVILATARHAGILNWLRAVYLIKWRPPVNSDLMQTMDRILDPLIEQLKAHVSKS